MQAEEVRPITRTEKSVDLTKKIRHIIDEILKAQAGKLVDIKELQTSIFERIGVEVLTMVETDSEKLKLLKLSNFARMWFIFLTIRKKPGEPITPTAYGKIKRALEGANEVLRYLCTNFDSLNEEFQQKIPKELVEGLYEFTKDAYAEVVAASTDSEFELPLKDLNGVIPAMTLALAAIMGLKKNDEYLEYFSQAVETVKEYTDEKAEGGIERRLMN